MLGLSGDLIICFSFQTLSQKSVNEQMMNEDEDTSDRRKIWKVCTFMESGQGWGMGVGVR